MRYLINFSYDGSKYDGYQKQTSKNTIQDALERVLYKINGNKKVILVASGRTDKGVHAINQYAHFDLEKKYYTDKLKYAINNLVNNDIYIKKIIEVSDDFHARFNVLSKEYIYKINLGEYNPIEKDYVYQYGKNLDIKAMQRALNVLLGEQNFKAFTTPSDVRKSYIRYISKSELHFDKLSNILTIKIAGNGFLRYMVRIIVGTVIEIGEGKRKVNDIGNILKSEDRRQAGITAPACGLYLNEVFYNKF